MDSSQAYWYVPNKVIYVQNIGKLTTDHFRSVDTEIKALMDEARANDVQKTHVVVDNFQLGGLPNITQLEGGKILKYMQHANCGWTIVAGDKHNTLLNVLSKFLTAVSHVNLQIVDSLDKAVVFLQQIEPSIEYPEFERWKDSKV